MSTSILSVCVAICTRNRASLLKRTLDALRNQTVGIDAFELLVVDNGSTDSTFQTAEAYANIFPYVRYVLEPMLGIANARNRAAQEATGKYLAYVDDDAIPDSSWLENLIRPFHQDQSALACVTGKVDLEWEGGRPAWIPAHYETLYAKYDFGPVAHSLTRGRYLLTTNVAFDRQVLLEIGAFRPELGHRGQCLLGGEDNDIFNRLLMNGNMIWYEPRALVTHWTPRKRQTRRWLVNRVFWDGATQPLLDYGINCARGHYFKEMLRDMRRIAWITHTRSHQLDTSQDRLQLFLEYVRQVGRLYMNGKLLLVQ